MSLRPIEVLFVLILCAVAAENVRQVLRKRGARHHHITAGFLGFHFQIALNVRDKADNRSALLVFGAHLGNHRQRLDAVAVQINNDERRLLLGVLCLLSNIFVGLNELDLHVEFARDLLDLGNKEKVFYEGEDPGGSVFPLGEGLHIGNGLGAIVEARTLLAGAVALIPVAMVHGADKSRSATALAAITPVLPVLATLSTVTTGSVLAAVLASKITSAAPRLTVVARLLRLVHSFIHSYTCELLVYLAGCPRGDLI